MAILKSLIYFLFFNTFLLGYLQIAVAGEIVIVPKTEIPQKPWREILENRGYAKEKINIFTGELYTKEASKDYFILLESHILRTLTGDAIIIEAVNAKTGVTILFAAYEIKNATEPCLKKWMYHKIEDIEKATVLFDKECAPVSIRLKESEPIEGKLGKLYIDFKKRLIDAHSFNLVNRNLTRDIIAIQDQFAYGGNSYKLSRVIDGNMCPIEVLCTITAEKGTWLSIQLYNPKDGTLIGKTAISSLEDMDKVITYIEEKIRNISREPVDVHNIIRLK